MSAMLGVAAFWRRDSGWNIDGVLTVFSRFVDVPLTVGLYILSRSHGLARFTGFHGVA
jgi:hypothetical protein